LTNPWDNCEHNLCQDRWSQFSFPGTQLEKTTKIEKGGRTSLISTGQLKKIHKSVIVLRAREAYENSIFRGNFVPFLYFSDTCTTCKRSTRRTK